MTRQHAMLAIGLACSLVAALAANLAAPGFETIYRDFGVELPWLTRMLLAGRRYLFALPLLVLLAWWLARSAPGRQDRRGLVALVGGLGLSMRRVPRVVIALYMPIFMRGAVVDG